MINEEDIYKIMNSSFSDDTKKFEEILSQARELKGLDYESIAYLLTIENEHLLEELFATAKEIKEIIYGKRIVLFAPLYISNLCDNECIYCAFRAKNDQLNRRSLTSEEIADETDYLVKQGHKRILLVAGESYSNNQLDYILDSIDTIYKTSNGGIRRINVNIAPLNIEQFKKLKESRIGTYQLFQETYHRETYERVHVKGKKSDYDWRINAIDRAFEAGIDDVGIGALFGLYDWRFELLALMQHIMHLENKYDIGPHTISIPRLEPASESEFSHTPPYAVNDRDFKKLIAILRLAVPYTGLILSTRESSDFRKEAFSLGISQISAGSRTNPGGYRTDEECFDNSQFQTGDHRPLDEVVQDVASMGFIPSFCTACYRLGRTGMDFMDLAKPGEIKKHCDPNALVTFMEYLLDYGSEETRLVGEKTIEKIMKTMDSNNKHKTEKMIASLMDGKRDIFC